MRLYEVFDTNSFIILQEGGNLHLPTGEAADTINLKIHNRTEIVAILSNLLHSLNSAFKKKFHHTLWDNHVLQTREFLSGSSLHLFNTEISDEEFTRVKPKVGDIDTQVDKHKETQLEELLNSNIGKVIGPAKFLGFKRGNEQFSSLWLLSALPIKIQIDMEFVGYEQGKPTPWAQFSHSSDWNDIKSGVKGVFHKYLIQSFSALTKQEFILRKNTGRGKNKKLVDVAVKDTMISFAVSSKEGGGLRQKYEPVIDATGKQEQVNGKPVFTARPTQGYDQTLASIFAQIFGKRLTKTVWKQMGKKFWSFTGLLEVMDKILDDSEKQEVIATFTEKLFAKNAQGLYKEDPDRDVEEKMIALKLMLEALDMPTPMGLEDKVKEYKENYTVDNNLTESTVPNYSRTSIKHISKPGSSAELKDSEFLDFVAELHANGGTLKNIPVSVKVDGAGCRFGRDDKGRPFS